MEYVVTKTCSNKVFYAFKLVALSNESIESSVFPNMEIPFNLCHTFIFQTKYIFFLTLLLLWNLSEAAALPWAASASEY